MSKAKSTSIEKNPLFDEYLAGEVTAQALFRTAAGLIVAKAVDHHEKLRLNGSSWRRTVTRYGRVAVPVHTVSTQQIELQATVVAEQAAPDAPSLVTEKYALRVLSGKKLEESYVRPALIHWEFSANDRSRRIFAEPEALTTLGGDDPLISRQAEYVDYLRRVIRVLDPV
ncbi:MAG TPA: hypothetical protein VLF91_04325 [Candidatus Saccharimonadales bacterium]|nr:hypothetical protein [Candidatus Saccharimonadales bacterium]